MGKWHQLMQPITMTGFTMPSWTSPCAVGVLHSIHTMLLAIQFMTFHVRTGYGDSTQTYGGRKFDRYMGLYQGNGAAPAGWFVITCSILLWNSKAGMVMW
jgi:hypothetical protein